MFCEEKYYEQHLIAGIVSKIGRFILLSLFVMFNVLTCYILLKFNNNFTRACDSGLLMFERKKHYYGFTAVIIMSSYFNIIIACTL